MNLPPRAPDLPPPRPPGGWLTGTLQRMVAGGSDLSTEQAMQRVQLALACLLAAPVVWYYGLGDLRAGRLFESACVLSVGLCIAAAPALLRLGWRAPPIARLLAVAVLLLQAYELELVSAGGQVFVLFYAFPLAAVFILGQDEGSVVVALSLLVSVFYMCVWPPTRDAYAAERLRFLLPYGVLSAMAVALEASRRHFARLLDFERSELRAALGEIAVLRQMLPICSWCKNVRDDQGYWRKIEEYLGRHIDMRFSHGICPDCAKAMSGEAEEALTAR